MTQVQDAPQPPKVMNQSKVDDDDDDTQIVANPQQARRQRTNFKAKQAIADRQKKRDQILSFNKDFNIRANKYKLERDLLRKQFQKTLNTNFPNGSIPSGSLFPSLISASQIAKASKKKRAVAAENYNQEQINKNTWANNPQAVQLGPLFQRQNAKFYANFNKKGYIDTFNEEREKKQSQWFNKKTDWGWIFNDQTKKWQNPNVNVKKLNPQKYQVRLAQNFSTSQMVMNKQITNEQAQKLIPSMLKETINANSVLYGTSFGPVSVSSLPLYAGRYIDRTTGRIRTFPAVSSKYINPTSYFQKMQYLESKLLVKWNNYVRAQQQLNKFYNVDPVTFQATQKKKLIKGLAVGPNYKKAFANMAQQIASYESGLIVPSSTKIVLSKCSQQQIKKLYQLYLPYTSNTQTFSPQAYATTSKSATAILKAAFETFQNTNPSTKELGKVAQAFNNWINKGQGDASRAVLRYFRSFIPPQIPSNEIGNFLDTFKAMEQKFKTKTGMPQLTQEGQLKGYQIPKNPTMEDFKNVNKYTGLSANSILLKEIKAPKVPDKYKQLQIQN